MNKQQTAEALGVLTCLRAYRHYLDEKEHERYLSHLSALQSVIEAGEKPLSAQGMVMVPENELPAALWYPLPEGRVIGENQRIESVVSMEDAYRCAAALKKAMIAARPKGSEE